MPVKAIAPDYVGEVKDSVDRFHGNIVVYVNWVDHLMFCSALAFPLPPDMSFGSLLSDLLPQYYGLHPDWARIDWAQARWELDRQPFTPDLEKGLAANGVGHKSVLRFTTPGLTGIDGSCT
ncbi:MAG: phenol hydroxylase [Telmatospirillum sp.]|nr:phenol hydroxylase [Telmatospirillum sp.]